MYKYKYLMVLMNIIFSFFLSSFSFNLLINYLKKFFVFIKYNLFKRNISIKLNIWYYLFIVFIVFFPDTVSLGFENSLVSITKDLGDPNNWYTLEQWDNLSFEDKYLYYFYKLFFYYPTIYSKSFFFILFLSLIFNLHTLFDPYCIKIENIEDEKTRK